MALGGLIQKGITRIKREVSYEGRQEKLAKQREKTLAEQKKELEYLKEQEEYKKQKAKITRLDSQIAKGESIKKKFAPPKKQGFLGNLTFDMDSAMGYEKKSPMKKKGKKKASNMSRKNPLDFDLGF